MQRPCWNLAIDSPAVDELENNASIYIRRFGCAKQRKRKRVSTPNDNVRDVVRLSWIGNTNEDRHLYIEVWIDLVFSAAVIFCYFHDNSFDFCLARGLRSSYEAMFGWMSSISDGWLLVETRPFLPQSSSLAESVAAWIATEYSLHHTDKASMKISPLVDHEAKSMILTFSTPRIVSEAGLETISLTVPPLSLWKLYSSMIQSRNEIHGAIVRKENSIENDDAVPYISALDSLPPIVRAMQCYIMEAFAIDISTFPLTKVVTSSATLGSDGRFKPCERNTGNQCTPSSLSIIHQLVNASRVP